MFKKKKDGWKDVLVDRAALSEHCLQCPARVEIESSRSESEKNSLSLFVREVKSEMKI